MSEFGTVQETQEKGGVRRAGGRRLKGRGRRRSVLLVLLTLAVLIPTALSMVLGVCLEQAWAELDQLRQTVDGPPPQIGAASSGGDTGDTGREEEYGNGAPERPAYQDLYPELYAKPHEWNRVDEEKVVYLTFDDGPSARTPEILEILEQYDVKATFFVVGKETGQAKQWMRDIVAAGHTLGVHSYSHDYNRIYTSVEAYLEDFAQMYHLILETTGEAPQIFRFPGGSINAYNGATYREIVSEMVRRGFVYYDWNRMTGDAVRGTVPVRRLVQNALNQVDTMRRSIVLMHDSRRFTNTVEALPAIIEGYREAGFTLAPLTPEVRPIIYAYPQ
ncbi:MAG: polysaccharide deacetylase [Lawsonibacter sp.]|nr:polysaccharide deacetylase [Lawsonibacter sp.]